MEVEKDPCNRLGVMQPILHHTMKLCDCWKSTTPRYFDKQLPNCRNAEEVRPATPSVASKVSKTSRISGASHGSRASRSGSCVSLGKRICSLEPQGVEWRWQGRCTDKNIQISGVQDDWGLSPVLPFVLPMESMQLNKKNTAGVRSVHVAH